MAAFTLTEQLENLDRTIAATAANIERKEAELNEIRSAHRANQRERIELARKVRLEQSPKAMWDRAVKSLRKDGVHFRTNIMQCCRGCVDAEKLNLKDQDQAYGWTFGGQDSWVKFNEDGLPYEKDPIRYHRADYRTAREVYINHGNGAGEKLAAAFKAEGFRVEWDGTESDTVTVYLTD